MKFHIDELKNYYPNDVIIALENLLIGVGDISSDSHRNALNDLVKLKFLKKKNKEFDSENVVANTIIINGIKYIFHSARVSF